MKGERRIFREIENCPRKVVISVRVSVPQQPESFNQNNYCRIRGNLVPLKVTRNESGTVSVLCSCKDCPLKVNHCES